LFIYLFIVIIENNAYIAKTTKIVCLTVHGLLRQANKFQSTGFTNVKMLTNA